MEAAPPSYQNATLTDYLDLAAGYIRSSDLCAAALVCTKWHSTVIPHLWGNPASHFGVEDDRVYIALTRFKRTLKIARLLVRSMTHTLHLPSADAEFYDGPRPNWLHDILYSLPNLQSLVVRGLPFFDHGALQTLLQARSRSEYVADVSSSLSTISTVKVLPLSLNLRLLDASHCPNVTAGPLANGLKRFQNLVYLDLSSTESARDSTVLSALHLLPNLHVLKLRSINLSDSGIQLLAMSIVRRVRSLDIRNNKVTDRGMKLLLDNCFARSPVDASSRPEQLPHLGQEMLDIYQGDAFESHLWRTLTKNFVGRFAFEDLSGSGISHLYISDNPVSVEGASSLLRSGHLRVFDVATCLGHIEELVPVLGERTSSTLTFLRVGHGVVTTNDVSSEKQMKVPDRVGLANTILDTNEATGHFNQDDQNVEPQRHDEADSYSSLRLSGRWSFSGHAEHRAARLAAHALQNRDFHPAMLPQLKTLILTSVPRFSPDEKIANNIIHFIKLCAEEVHLAYKHAVMDYTAPPGRQGSTLAIKDSAHRAFALQKIVLEIAPESPPVLQRHKASGCWQQASIFTQSVTDDPDSEALWRAAEKDFSFFDADEEPRLPSLPSSQQGETTEMDHGVVAPPLFDTIARIAAFRQDRKLAHVQNQGKRKGVFCMDTPGYWDGILQVVRCNPEMG